MKNFSIVGVGGFVAPRHLKAIKDTGNDLLSAFDVSDSVGILDSYFSQAAFFTREEAFDRYNCRMKRLGHALDYLTICAPNHVHDYWMRYGLRLGADVICEKPMVLNPWNLDHVQDVEKETGKHTYTILQLRLHDSVRALKKMIEVGPKDKVYDVDLTYIASRGKWYYASWKGDVSKSGGVATNIGVHFYDMLCWIFGPMKKSVVHVADHDRVAGFLELERARVRYFLSINADHLSEEAGEKRTYRVIRVDGKILEFSEGFTELHTKSYENILAGKGFGIEDARNAIELGSDKRNATPVGLVGDYHPMAKYPLTKHPFEC